MATTIPIQELCYMYLHSKERLYEPNSDLGCPDPWAVAGDHNPDFVVPKVRYFSFQPENKENIL